MRTVEHIRRMIHEGAGDFYVRQKAIDILLERRIRPKDYVGEVKALFEWVQSNVRYVRDPHGIETIHGARRMLWLRAGDCDDVAILLGSMLMSIGHPVRLVLTGPDPRRPSLLSHIYLEANVRGGWIPLDATMPYGIGWAPRAPIRKVIPIGRRSDRRELVGSVRRVGDVLALIYRRAGDTRDAGRAYIHFMRRPPALMTNAGGTQLYLVGGGYRVTARGIENVDPGGEEASTWSDQRTSAPTGS
jgi:hypothetical protein